MVHYDSPLIDSFFYYVFPVVCMVGLCFSITSIAVFAKINLKKSSLKIYKYLLVYSVSDTVSLFISLFVGFARCGLHCGDLDQTYLVKFYEFFVYMYLGNVIYTFSALIDLTVAINRLIKISDRKIRSRLTPLKLMLILFLASSVVNVPHLIVFNLKEINVTSNGHDDELNLTATDFLMPIQSFYTIEMNESSHADGWMNIMFTVLLFLKDLFLLIFLFSINLMMAFSLRYKMNRSRYSDGSPTRESQSSNVLIKLACSKLSLMKEGKSMMKEIENKRLATSSTRSTTNNNTSSTAIERYDDDCVSQQEIEEKVFVKESTDVVDKSVQMNDLSSSADNQLRCNTRSNLKCLNGYMERRVTIMIICLCFLFFLGHIPEMLYGLIIKINSKTKDSLFSVYFIIFSNFLAYSTRGIDFFIYFIFNITFRNTFKNMFCKCLRSKNLNRSSISNFNQSHTI